MLLWIGSGALVAHMMKTRADTNARTYFIYDSAIDPLFKQRVEDIINADTIWKHKGFTLTRTHTSGDADFNIKLVPRRELDKYHKPRENYKDGSEIRFSFTINRRDIVIDAQNWTRGVIQSGLNLEEYQRYVILHEVGHALGYDHVACKKAPCPIMYQMTRGLESLGSTLNR